MKPALLDVNVLLALAWPVNVHHRAAHRWFDEQRRHGWATCPLVQLAFVRLSLQPVVTKTTVSISDAMRILVTNVSSPEHRFWPLEQSISEVNSDIRNRLIGHRQLTDALLLDLAIRQGGKLATFDRRVENLLPPDSAHHSALEILRT